MTDRKNDGCYRKCNNHRKTCKAKINGEWVEVPFHGIFQYSDTIAPFGAVIAYPVAVIELENQLIMRSLDTVKDI